MAVQRVESQYYKALDAILTSGGKKQMENGAEVIKNFSPNNLRRLILGLDGIFAQFYVSNGVTKTEHLQELQMTDRLLPEVCESNTNFKAPLNLLRGLGGSSRVYSSVEEIIILERNPNFPAPFVNTGLKWFAESEQVKTSFKRLRCITIIKEPLTIQQFLSSAEGYLKDPLTTITEKTPFQKEGKMLADKDYLLHTALRPQFYDLDAKGGRLDQRFTKIKELYNQSLLQRVSKKTEIDVVDYGLECVALYSYLEDLTSKCLEMYYDGSSYVSNLQKDVIEAVQKVAGEWKVNTNVKKTSTKFDAINYFLALCQSNHDKLSENHVELLRRIAYSMGYLLIDLDEQLKRSRSLRQSLETLKSKLDVSAISTVHSLLSKIEVRVVDFEEPEIKEEEPKLDLDLVRKILDLASSNGVSVENDVENWEKASVNLDKLSVYDEFIPRDVFMSYDINKTALASVIYKLVKEGISIDEALYYATAASFEEREFQNSSLQEYMDEHLPDLVEWNSLKNSTVETGRVRPTLAQIYEDLDNLVNSCRNYFDILEFKGEFKGILEQDLKQITLNVPFSLRAKELKTYIKYENGLQGVDDTLTPYLMVNEIYKIVKMKVPVKTKDIGAIFDRAMKRAGGG